MAKPNISPLTFRPDEKTFDFIANMKSRGFGITKIIISALKFAADYLDEFMAYLWEDENGR